MTVPLYLDVDETINVQMPTGWGRTQQRHVTIASTIGAGGWGAPRVWNLRVRWAPAMLDALAELPVEIVWLTSWGNQARTHLAPRLGWGEDYRSLAEPPDAWDFTTMEWKVPAMLTERGREDHFVWLDDELTQQEVDEFPNALILPIHQRMGVSPADIETIAAYLATIPV